MTKKDFALIAAALRATRVTNASNNPNRALFNNAIDNASARLADALSTTSANFDRIRFLTACGLDSAPLPPIKMEAIPRHCPHGVLMRGQARCEACDATSDNVVRS